jgi:hypothetical protein
MLAKLGDWIPLGSADEQKSAAEETVDAWARSSENPAGGWYGMRKATGDGRSAQAAVTMIASCARAEFQPASADSAPRA